MQRKSSASSSKLVTLTGQDARIIMGADQLALEKLWLRKRGTEPRDAEEALAVELAKASVPANRAHFERRTGRKIVEGEARVRHPKLRWMGAILDGKLKDGTLFQAEFASAGFMSAEVAKEIFQARAQHDLWVAGAKSAALSIVTADGRWFETCVEADPLFQHLLITAEKRFLRDVESNVAPGLFLIEARPALTVVDMSGSPPWAKAARQFRATARAHAEHEQARARLVDLLPPDAFRAAAAGVAVERAAFSWPRFALTSEMPEAAHA